MWVRLESRRGERRDKSSKPPIAKATLMQLFHRQADSRNGIRVFYPANIAQQSKLFTCLVTQIGKGFFADMA
jgi:hypothetical protein